jgi:hypothetical protein
MMLTANPNKPNAPLTYPLVADVQACQVLFGDEIQLADGPWGRVREINPIERRRSLAFTCCTQCGRMDVVRASRREQVRIRRAEEPQWLITLFDVAWPHGEESDPVYTEKDTLTVGAPDYPAAAAIGFATLKERDNE